ncbi:helix-turn-helix domain-containing protein [Mycobacterium riyadhense]|uniref:helix-turn-helix domain-containing protein n=1 Tax=Mycobacterium riyadhense TaxID=486698 RepID=UPI003B8A725E
MSVGWCRQIKHGNALVGSPREERAEVVASLRESGLSLRAIAAATGDSHMTIQRELAGVSKCYT